MSQADYDIANQLMDAGRTDLNLQLVAGVTNNSGATEPATTFAYMWWPDTTTGILKQRNAANTAWINKGTLAIAFVDFTTAKDSKLTGIEASATADQTGAEIKSLYQAQANAFTDAKNTKLTGIEASADITDTANVTSAGALMDSEVSANLKTFVLPASTTISAFGKTLIDDAAASNARATLGLVIGTNVLPEIPLVTQPIAEAGTSTVEKTWSAQRVKQAIAALASGKIVQVVNTQTGAVATGTTIMPIDNTIPQNTEGNEYMTLAITPTSSANILEITIVTQVSHTAASEFTSALFQDSTVGALAAIRYRSGANNNGQANSFKHRMVAGTTSLTTFRVRCGAPGGGTFTFNGQSSSRLYGGVSASSITIKEIKV